MPSRPLFQLHPERCDRCGKCTAVCDPGCIRVGAHYIYVDWDACNGCGACQKACKQDALVPLESIRARKSVQRATGASGKKQSTKKVKSTSKTKVHVRPKAGAAGWDWSLLEMSAVFAAAIALLVAKDAILTQPWVASLSVRWIVIVRSAVLFVYYGAQLAVLVWLAKRRGASVRDVYRLKGLKAAYVLWIPATVVGVWAVYIMYGAVVQAMGWAPPGSASSLTQLFGPDVTGLGIVSIMVVFAGPVVETCGVFCRSWCWVSRSRGSGSRLGRCGLL